MFYNQAHLLPGGNETQSSLELRLRRCRNDRETLRASHSNTPDKRDTWILCDQYLARTEKMLIQKH